MKKSIRLTLMDGALMDGALMGGALMDGELMVRRVKSDCETATHARECLQHNSDGTQ